jgi:hypothetical protein
VSIASSIFGTATPTWLRGPILKSVILFSVA